MNKNEFLNKVMEIKESEIIEVITNGEEEILIEQGDNFIGGRKETYMSSILGDVYYSSLDSIATALYDYLTEELMLEVKEVII